MEKYTIPQIQIDYFQEDIITGSNSTIFEPTTVDDDWSEDSDQ